MANKRLHTDKIELHRFALQLSFAGDPQRVMLGMKHGTK